MIGKPKNLLSDVLQWLRGAPEGTLVPAAAIAERLEHIEIARAPAEQPDPPTWRERLWTAHPDTRLGVAELLEGIGRPKSWLYRHTGDRADCARIPHRKMDGALVFVVGEIRTWLADHEEVAVPGRRSSLVRESRDVHRRSNVDQFNLDRRPHGRQAHDSPTR